MVNDIVKYLWDNGYMVVFPAIKRLNQDWDLFADGSVFIIHKTNPQTYEDSVINDMYKFIHQIDGPPKFTVDNVTVIRKTGELILSDGIIEWEGFDMFREAILHLVTMEEAIKIVEGW